MTLPMPNMLTVTAAEVWPHWSSLRVRLLQYRRCQALITLAVAGTPLGTGLACTQEMPADFPSWAYVMNEVVPRPAVSDDGTLFSVTVAVKESSRVPRVNNLGMFFAASEDGLQEDIGSRIVEVPQNLPRFEVVRDDRVQFTAYVPPGSVAQGLALTRAPGGNPALA